MTPNIFHSFLFFLLSYFTVLPTMQAVSPPPDGGYPGFTTAEGSSALQNLTSGTQNTAIGFQTLFSITTGSQNTALGTQALKSNTANRNTANGFQALFWNTVGRFNTASGASALFRNTTGERNTATGDSALYSNTTGDSNTANGVVALFRNTIGVRNTATGDAALYSNISGDGNTASGVVALDHNTTGDRNTANGDSALYNNTTGDSNTAVGVATLDRNTTGHGNAATGDSALYYNTSGYENTANGVSSLLNNSIGHSNTALGAGALFGNTTGNFNVGLGVGAGENLTTGNNNVDILNPGVAGESNTIRIGIEGIQTRTFIAGIRGVAVTGTSVVVNGSGQLGVAASSARFKDAIKPMDKTSEAVLALRPVTFHYKKEIDPACTSQFGLVAEEVAAVNPDLVVRDENGKIYTVRYEAVNAMLLNEFLKEHKTVQEQAETISIVNANFARQEATIARLEQQIEALTMGLQKVNAQLEASKPAPQVVNNP